MNYELRIRQLLELTWARFLFAFIILNSIFLILPISSAYAAGMTVSGGGSKTNGSNFTMTVKASGTAFDSLQGTISVTGPVTIVSFSPGSASWLPGKSPANNTQFVGIVSATSSFTVATITLRGSKEGTGKVTVSGVQLARNGSYVGSDGGSASFTITRAPTPPGGVTVSSTTHPSQEESYEATTAAIAWTAPTNGADGYSYVFDQVADTTPAATANTTATTASFPDLKVGTYYFHVRAHNTDGWGATTHFKINIKNTLNNSLTAPIITSVTLASDYTNDIEAGTLTGITFKGTGLPGYTLKLTFTPEISLPLERYPAITIAEDGSWVLNITDPVKSGYYKLTALAEKDGTVTPTSAPTNFEVSVAEGGKIRLISADDVTATYKQKQQALVAAANTQKRNAMYLTIGGILVIALGLGFFFVRRRILSKIN